LKKNQATKKLIKFYQKIYTQKSPKEKYGSTKKYLNGTK